MQARFEHATEEALESYSLGTLSEAETEVLEEHLLICSACQDRLSETDTYVRHMQAAAGKLRGRKVQKRGCSARRFAFALVRSRLVWAAAGVCCLLVGLWGLSSRTGSLPADSPPVAIALQAIRGQEDSSVATAPKGRALLLEADLTGLPVKGLWHLEVVDAEGRPARLAQAKPDGCRVMVTVPGLDQGTYWVRLYSSATRTELLREYALRVE